MDSMADVFLNQNYREFAKLLSYAQARSNAVYDYIKEPSKIFPNQRKTVKRYILFQYMTDLLRSKKSIINSAEFGIYTGVTSLMMEAFFGQFLGYFQNCGQ